LVSSNSSYCARHISVIILIRYILSQKFGKSNIVKVFGSKKTKDLNRMAKIWEQENKRSKQDGQNQGARKQKI
jgi:hypothetical protein